MTFLFAALIAAAPLAQATPAPAPAPAPAAAPAAATKFNLDTPIETLVADPAAKKVLDTDMGADITTNPSYDQFKGMSFNQVAPYAPDKLPAALLAKIGADLAAIK
jgi:hypothetical protein